MKNIIKLNNTDKMFIMLSEIILKYCNNVNINKVINKDNIL